jgi:hypothetical protein
MLINIILCVLLVAVMLAWFGKRRESMLIFGLDLILAVAVFFHHVTTAIGLSL